jgi:hypothetical protein
MANMSQDVKFAIINALASRNMTMAEANALIGPPVVGRAGWIHRYAERAAARNNNYYTIHHHRRIAEEAERQKELYQEHQAQKIAAAAAEREKQDDTAAKSGGYCLYDTNKHYYNCGHYPQYVVKGAMRPEDVQYETRQHAEEVMRRKNAASNLAWAAYLNG